MHCQLYALEEGGEQRTALVRRDVGGVLEVVRPKVGAAEGRVGG